MSEGTTRTFTAAPSHGLDSDQAAQRLREFGPNEIAREQAASPWQLLAAPFHSPVIWLLFGACTVSAALGEVADAVAIGAIVIINGVVGFFQAYRAVSAEPAEQRDRGDDGQAS